MPLTSEKVPWPSMILDFPAVSPPPLASRDTRADWPLLQVMVPLPLAVEYTADHPASEYLILHVVELPHAAGASATSDSIATLPMPPTHIGFICRISFFNATAL